MSTDAPYLYGSPVIVSSRGCYGLFRAHRAARAARGGDAGVCLCFCGSYAHVRIDRAGAGILLGEQPIWPAWYGGQR